jgi:Domain of unknown function (DUF5979)
MTQDFAADANDTKRKGRIIALMALLLAALLISGTAIYAQNLTKFSVAKTITGPAGAPALTNLNFGVNANCTPSAVAPNQTINYGIGAGATTFGAPASATCTVTETSMPFLPAVAQEYCKKLGLVASWGTQTYSLNGGPATTNAPSFVVSTPAILYNSVTINNRWQCLPGKTGQLSVRKIASGPKGSPLLPSLGFGVNVNCSPAVTPANVIVMSNGGGANFTPVMGASCTITEAPQPALPANTQEFCAAQGGTAAWNAPVYTPNGTTTPPTVIIGSTPQAVLIANTWSCRPVEKSKLTVRKIVSGQQGAPALTNMNFGVNANCTPAMTPATLTVNNGTGGGSVTFTVVTGAVCTVSESTTMPAFPAIANEYCLSQGGAPVWDSPVYTPNGNTTPPTVTVSGSSLLVTITNKWRCKQVQMVKLQVRKNVIGQQGAPSLGALSFGINANCTPAATPPNQTVTNGGSVTFPVQTGANCTVTESSVMPVFPTVAVEYCLKQGGTPVWHQPVYMPNGTVTPPTITMTISKLVTVTNKWRCKQEAIVTLAVRKYVFGPQGGPFLTGLNFGINANCTPATTPSNQTVANGGFVSFVVQMGAICTVTESSVPAFPAIATEYCLGKGGTPFWDQPTYMPNGTTTPPTLTMNTQKNVTVTNRWRCKQNETVKLEVRKKVNGPQNAPIFSGLSGGLTFPVNANCTPATMPAIMFVTAGGSVYFNVQSGAICTVTEGPPPAFPPVAVEYCATKGGTPVWDPPVYIPSGNTTPPTVTVVGPTTVVQIINTWSCKVAPKRKLEVRKELTGPVGAPSLGNLNFAINANCSPAVGSPNQVISVGAPFTYVVPNGTTCTISESTTMPAFPPNAVQYCLLQGGTPSWNAPIYNPVGNTTPSTVTVNASGMSVTISNSWRCIPNPPRTLTVRKTVISPPGVPPLGSLNFGVIATCTPATSPSSQTVTSGGSVTFTVQAGAICTVTESSVMPAFPPLAVQLCANSGAVPVWNPPVYTPNGTTTPPTVTISAPNTLVNITNSWSCKKLNGQINLTKIVQGPTAQLPNMTFTINAACTPAASVASVAITTTYPHGGTAGGAIIAPIGANCTLTEVQPPVNSAMTAFCGNNSTPVWEPFVPVNMTITSAPQNLTVINKWKCVPKTGSLEVMKEVTNPSTAVYIPPQSFVMNINCSPSISQPTVTLTGWPGASSMVNNIPVGSTCSIVEQTPIPVPSQLATYCASQGMTFQWDAPTYTNQSNVPVSSVTITSGVNSIKVRNHWRCLPNTGQLEIMKSFTTIPTAVQWPATNWIINTNCSPAGSVSSVTVNTSASGNAVIDGSYPNIISVPVGANCIIEEPTSSLPAFPSWITAYCGNAANGSGTPQWNVPSYTYNGQTTTTPLTFVMTAGIHTVTVNNGWSCVPNAPGSQAQIFKKVIGPPPGVMVPPVFSANFTIVSNCSTASSPTSVSATASDNGLTVLGGVITVPAGANCQYGEPVLPAFPAAANTYCANSGQGVPVWETPVISTTNGTNMTNVYVTNKWKCVMNHPWILSVIKTVQGPAGAPPLPVLPYVIDRNCTGVAANGGTPMGSATINTATTSNAINVGGLVTVGAHCTLSEVQPPLPPAAVTYCANQSPAGIATWNAPAYSLPMPIAGDFPANNKTVTVTNSWFCLSTQKVAPPKKKKKPKFKINIGIGIGGGGGGGDNPKPPRDIPNGP